MSAKILLLDIETAPGLGWAWSKFDTNIIEFERDWFILSIAYKWFGVDDKITVKALPGYTSYKKNPLDDSALIADIQKLLDEADIVVAHNGDSFDVKKINTRILVHNLPQPSPYKTFDTLKIARKNFKFDSNRLNDLCQVLGIGKKLPHVGFALWKGCMKGDMAAWETMVEYNAQDVNLLEEIYLRLRSWGNHPDVNLYGDTGSVVASLSCPSCGSHNVQRRGTAVSRTRKYQRLHCQDCGHWGQGDQIKEGKK
jgi:hypothetical protein